MFLGQWTDADREYARQYLLYKSQLCNKCGTNPADWLDEKGIPIEPPPFETQQVMCYGCMALEESRASVTDKSKTGSVIHRLARVPKAVAERKLAQWQMSRSRSD